MCISVAYRKNGERIGHSKYEKSSDVRYKPV